MALKSEDGGFLLKRRRAYMRKRRRNSKRKLRQMARRREDENLRHAGSIVKNSWRSIATGGENVGVSSAWRRHLHQLKIGGLNLEAFWLKC